MHKFELRQSHQNKLTARLKEVLDSGETLKLHHSNGLEEELIVGVTHGSVFVYNTEPDLIGAFEIEGGVAAEELNIKDCARWLYFRSKEPTITR